MPYAAIDIAAVFRYDGGEVRTMTERLEHPIAPVFDETSKVLILGSFPSVKSRETGFFYGHPQNRFSRRYSAARSRRRSMKSVPCCSRTMSRSGT